MKNETITRHVKSIESAIVVVLLVLYQIAPSANLVFLPVFVLLVILSALAIGIWMSALTIRYRDFQHVVPFMVQFGLYATPVGYPAELVVKNLPEWANYLYFMNPMAGIVEGFRWCILGGAPPSVYTYFSLSLVVLLFITGLMYFRRVEKVMADIV